MTNIKNALWAGIFFGIIFGTLQGLMHGINAAIIGGPVSGLLFGAIMHWFMHSKVFERHTQIETANGESIIQEGGANHLRNGKAVGGKLYLLTNQLLFKSHDFNLQNHELVMDIDQINNITFYNSFGLVPNGLAVWLKDGGKEKFVVSGRQQWKMEIEKRRAAKA